MNRERILELADIIEKQPHTSFNAAAGFFMDAWRHACGSPSCIAGWAVHVAKRRCPTAWIWDEAQEFLELNDAQGRELFMGDGRITLSFVTPPHAAAVLRHLAATGKVDWSIGAPSEEPA